MTELREAPLQRAGMEGKLWGSVIMPRVGWFMGAFFVFSPHCWSLPISCCFVYLPTFIFVRLSRFQPLFGLGGGQCWVDGNSAVFIHVYLCVYYLAFRTRPWKLPCKQQQVCILVCVILQTFMGISACVCVYSRCVASVVITVDPWLHNRELCPPWSLKLHHRDPCDLQYLQASSQLLGAKTRNRQTDEQRHPVFPFGVKSKCGNKKQRVREWNMCRTVNRNSKKVRKYR